MAIPKYHEFYNPVLAAMRSLGGSASVQELNERVTQDMQMSDADIAEPHDDRTTELHYRLAWARSYLKMVGLLDNTSRGVWVLTPAGREVESVDPREVSRIVREQTRGKKGRNGEGSAQPLLEQSTATAEVVLEEKWRSDLLAILRALAPDAFERLCQRILRESGFVEVRVTGRTGDGGIDGVGLVRLGGLLSFPVLFQCKRYKGTVGPGEVRDFRGAMVGRTDRGLFLTTGTFTREAQREATRDGAPTIDLVDNELLLDKLKDLGLGVKVKLIEEVSIVGEFFQSI